MIIVFDQNIEDFNSKGLAWKVNLKVVEVFCPWAKYEYQLSSGISRLEKKGNEIVLSERRFFL